MARNFGAATKPTPQAAKPAPAKPAPAPQPSKAVATQATGTSVVVKGLADRMKAAADQRKGFEGMSSKDFAIPFIKIADKNSPIAMKGSDKYVEGIEPGMIFNTVSKTFWNGDTGIYVIDCGFKSVIIEYESTEPGSGFIAEHPSDSDIKSDATTDPNGRLVLPNGHCLVDSNNHYVLMLSEDNQVEQCVIAMSGTNLTVSRQWNTVKANRKAQLPDGTRFTPPTYGVIYNLKTKVSKGDQFIWHNWEIFDDGLIEDEALFTRAEEFYETVLEGNVRANYKAEAEPTAAPAGKKPAKQGDDSDIPF